LYLSEEVEKKPVAVIPPALSILVLGLFLKMLLKPSKVGIDLSVTVAGLRTKSAAPAWDKKVLTSTLRPPKVSDSIAIKSEVTGGSKGLESGKLIIRICGVEIAIYNTYY
jgi:hypothetical protein